jgi:hypothetical protein
LRYIRSLPAVSDRRPKSIRRISIVPNGVSDRVTVRPPFDPQEFARQSERATLPPPPDRMPSDAPELVSGSMEVVWPVEATSIPRLAVAREDLEWFELPPQARRLLEHVDGEATVSTISERAAVAILDATELFDELVREGIVTA